MDSCALFAPAILCFQHITESFAKNTGGGGITTGGFRPEACLHCWLNGRPKTTGRLSVECYEVIVAALADDKKSMHEDASGIAGPRVVGHFAENPHNTGSVLHAK